MKKIFLTLFAMSTITIYTQQTINIINNTPYNLSNSLIGSDQTNNCYPNVGGTNYPIMVPPNSVVSYTGYYNSQLQNPPINSWAVQLNPTSSIPNQPGASPILIALGSATTWQMNKFSLYDLSGMPLANSGASIGMIGCNTPIITNLSPTPTMPYIFNAMWYMVGGEMNFLIQ